MVANFWRAALMTRFAVMSGAVFCATAGYAGIQTWINPTGGLFSDSSNWRSGVPLIGDQALFNLADAFTVQFDQGFTNDLLRVRNGDITFDLGGFTYSLGSTTSDAIVVGANFGDVATLRVSNGTLSGKAIRLASSSGAQGTLIIDGSQAVVTATGNFNAGYFGAGTLLIQNGGTLNSLNGFVGVIADGVATVTGAGSKWMSTNGLTVGGPGGALDTLDVFSGGTIVSQSVSLSTTGRLGGDGIVQGSVNNQGGVAPGGNTHAGVLNITGNYSQGPFSLSTLSIELGGPLPGSGYDVLLISGAATLNRTLAVTLIDGFAPPPGWTFDVLTAGSVSGTFTLLSLPALPGGGTLTVQYLPDRVRLIAPGQPMLGDANGDGVVNVDDLLMIINAWGICPSGPCPADLDHNGVVNVDDLLGVINGWGPRP